MDGPNLFKTLSVYGSSQSENYLTEAFTFTLKSLKAVDELAFRSVVERLCGLATDSTREDDRVLVSTQSGLPKGRPDIMVKLSDRLNVFIEVKDWSPLAQGQLEGYSQQIQQQYGEQGRLVLLTRTRHSIQETELPADHFHHVCWYEVHSWLVNVQVDDGVVANYIAEFTSFLEGKAMGVQKVTWEYENGVKSMLILSNQLETAVADAWPTSDVRRTAGWSWRGLYVDDEYFIGSRYDEPGLLVFESDKGISDASYKTDLALADVHYHSLTAGEQLETLTEFLKSARAEAEQQQP